MDLLLILTYTAICVAVFKIFRIPLNKWSVPTAVLGGILIIGILLLLMNYNHPYSEVVRQYYVTTPIIPEVRGRVIEVPVQPNQPVKEGDVLYRIDAAPFEDKLRGIEGEIAAARKDLERSRELFAKQAISERALDQSRASVDDLQAKLDDARFDLEQTVVKAPSEGIVTQLALRPGMMAVPLPLSPAMTFIHKQEGAFIGWFRQNSLLRLESSSEAEVTLDSIPGVIFAAEVAEILPVIGEGQVSPGAQLMRFGQQRVPGRVAVKLQIRDPRFEEFRLPGGVFGQAAIYSDHFHHVAVMRKVLLRMAAWMNYVFPLH
ncbi:HlyD family secretion protein [Thiorhodococcus minor]|uniref:HlyD family secretion protein n=1 Tax=Thiorhodococcus minor TaxID=57489 RepID=A0A6M0K482_9GAMM|nr:biotin/lipoyl-binding protein [Thiorhodococcus minor]NEV64586.1 HlyD family secretion protein [Thiorhodococcus minor]